MYMHSMVDKIPDYVTGGWGRKRSVDLAEWLDAYLVGPTFFFPFQGRSCWKDVTAKRLPGVGHSMLNI